MIDNSQFDKMNNEELKKEISNLKSQLSGLTHALANSLCSSRLVVSRIIRSLASEYDNAQMVKKAVLDLQSLSTTLTISGQLINISQIYFYPDKLKKEWEEDSEQGSYCFNDVINAALQSALNHFFYRGHNHDLRKFLPDLTPEQCRELRQNFLSDVVLKEDTTLESCISWLNTNFPSITVESSEQHSILLANKIRFGVLYSIFSELAYNAMRFAVNSPVEIKWVKKEEFYYFTCHNSFDRANRYKEASSQKGLSFIHYLLSLLKQSCLEISEENNVFKATVKIHEDNFK